MAEDKDWKPSYPPKAKGLPILEYLAMMGAIAAGKKITTHSKSGYPLELPIVAGEDYETEGIDTYKPGRREFTDDGERINAPIIPNRNPIYGSFDDGVLQKGDPESPGWDPMPTTTGQTIYDMTERGPEGEVIHRKPMQGPHGRPNVLDVAPEGGMIKEVLDSDKSIMEEGSPPSDEELLKVVGYLRQMGIMR